MKSGPSVHSVQFYDSHEALVDRLCGIVSSALLIGDTVMVVATEQHREQLIEALSILQVDAVPYGQANRLLMYDAAELLAGFMVDAVPDRELFQQAVGDVLQQNKRPGAGLVVFGEMVAVLWDEGNRAGALALEDLWNDLLKTQAIQLHCAYQRGSFFGDEAAIFQICASHSQVLGAPAPSMIVN